VAGEVAVARAEVTKTLAVHRQARVAQDVALDAAAQVTPLQVVRNMVNAGVAGRVAMKVTGRAMSSIATTL
jgi:hypothetical protein